MEGDHRILMQDPKQKQIEELKSASKIRIQADYDHNTYSYRPDPFIDEYDYNDVSGWCVRLNGIKFPRPKYDYERNDFDWSWRYTPEGGQSDEAKHKAIESAFRDARLPWSQLQK